MGQVIRRDARTRRMRVLELAATGLGPRAIARELGLSERAVKNHLAAPEVAGELRALADERLRLLGRRLLTASDKALATLLAVMGDADAPPGVRVSAAARVLESVGRMHETATILERLAALEAAVQGPRRVA